MNDAAQQLLDMIDRIHTACLTVGTLPPGGPRGFFSTWPAYKLDWYDAEEFGFQRTDESITKRLIQPPRFFATPKQIDDCLPALALLNGVTPLERRCVRYRATQLWYGEHVDASDEAFAHLRGGWRAIGRLARCSHTTARNSHKSAMLYALRRQIEGSRQRTQPLSKSLA